MMDILWIVLILSRDDSIHLPLLIVFPSNSSWILIPLEIQAQFETMKYWNDVLDHVLSFWRHRGVNFHFEVPFPWVQGCCRFCIAGSSLNCCWWMSSVGEGFLQGIWFSWGFHSTPCLNLVCSLDLDSLIGRQWRFCWPRWDLHGWYVMKDWHPEYGYSYP